MHAVLPGSYVYASRDVLVTKSFLMTQVMQSLCFRNGIPYQTMLLGELSLYIYCLVKCFKVCCQIFPTSRANPEWEFTFCFCWFSGIGSDCSFKTNGKACIFCAHSAKLFSFGI